MGTCGERLQSKHNGNQKVITLLFHVRTDFRLLSLCTLPAVLSLEMTTLSQLRNHDLRQDCTLG